LCYKNLADKKKKCWSSVLYLCHSCQLSVWLIKQKSEVKIEKLNKIWWESYRKKKCSSRASLLSSFQQESTINMYRLRRSVAINQERPCYDAFTQAKMLSMPVVWKGMSKGDDRLVVVCHRCWWWKTRKFVNNLKPAPPEKQK
jgi:hypothetical protein